jgi:hypothetical protein
MEADNGLTTVEMQVHAQRRTGQLEIRCEYRRLNASSRDVLYAILGLKWFLDCFGRLRSGGEPSGRMAEAGTNLERKSPSQLTTSNSYAS